MVENVLIEPPLYFAGEHVFDICFHPNSDLLATALIDGQVQILRYSSEDVNSVLALTHHKQSCRQVLFTEDELATISKDRSFAIVDQNGKLKLQMKKAHEDAINSVYFLNSDILATGDDSGAAKVWDLRQCNGTRKPIFYVSEQSDAVTGIVSTDNNHFMLCSSQDGTLAVYDLRREGKKPKSGNRSKNKQKVPAEGNDDADGKLYALSDCMEEDLMSITLLKHSQFVASSTSEGVILLFKWDWFGDCKDRILGHPNSIDAMIKLDENTLITGAEDGFVRGVSVYPNQIVATLGQHEENQNFPIQRLSISHCRNFLASCSHDDSIKFYDISDFVKKRDSTQSGDLPENDEENLQKQVVKKISKKKKKINEDEGMEQEDQQEQSDNQADKNHQEDDDDDDEDDDDDDDDDDEDDDDDDDMNDSSDDKQNIQEEEKKPNKRKKLNIYQRKNEIEREKRQNFFKGL